MPIYAILCPDCGLTARSVVFVGCKMPSEWVCVHCDGRRAYPDPDRLPEPHPWESSHGSGCFCCGTPENLQGKRSAYECVTDDEPT